MKKTINLIVSLGLSAAFLTNTAFAESALYDGYIDYVKSDYDEEFKDWYEYDSLALEYLLWLQNVDPKKIDKTTVDMINGMYEAYTFGALSPAGLSDISKAEISKIPAQKYTGKAIAPSPTVSLDGKKLIKNKDYSLRYNNIREVGTATVTITGLGDYYGVINKDFSIVKATAENKSNAENKSTAEDKTKSDIKIPPSKKSTAKSEKYFPGTKIRTMSDLTGAELLKNTSLNGYPTYIYRRKGNKDITDYNKYLIQNKFSLIEIGDNQTRIYLNKKEQNAVIINFSSSDTIIVTFVEFIKSETSSEN